MSSGSRTDPPIQGYIRTNWSHDHPLFNLRVSAETLYSCDSIHAYPALGAVGVSNSDRWHG
jgi:hypothetical protein